MGCQLVASTKVSAYYLMKNVNVHRVTREKIKANSLLSKLRNRWEESEEKNHVSTIAKVRTVNVSGVQSVIYRG